MAKPIDLTGQKFGKLTAVKWTGKSTNAYGRIWLCQCECGVYREVPVNQLRNQGINSCEKCADESRRKRWYSFTKRMTERLRDDRRDKLRNVWRNMKQRCYNSKHKSYTSYGGRGITVCNSWLNNFESFRDWAYNNGYSEGLTIERIDNNGNYEPANCRWATRKEQTFNRRSSACIYYEGKKIPLALFVYELGLDYCPVHDFLRNYNKESYNDSHAE